MVQKLHFDIFIIIVKFLILLIFFTIRFYLSSNVIHFEEFVITFESALLMTAKETIAVI